jgi:predicted ester cyclase
MSGSTIQERLAWPVEAATYRRIKRLWVRHSIAEDRRDLEGLIDTLAPDCVYEIVPTGQRWEGHDGARSFYTTFLRAFPDVHFDLTDIVIGPQGVLEVATMTATHEGEWAGLPPSGRQVRLTILIHFPWDPRAGRFGGERIYFDRLALAPV